MITSWGILPEGTESYIASAPDQTFRQRTLTVDSRPMAIPLGIAPDSWGIWFANDDRQMPWPRVLDEMQQVGFEWIELGPYGFLPTDENSLRSELEQRGLKLCACIVESNLEDPSNWHEIERQLLGSGELATALGARFCILIDAVYSDVGPYAGPTQLEDDEWKQLIETSHRVAQTAQERFGLQTLIHPNADTHVEHEDQIERFMEETDPALIGLCIDTGHVAYHDIDPAALFHRHHKRVPHVHLKSTSAEVLQQVHKHELCFAQAVSKGAFCEPANGSVDFTTLQAAMREVGYSGLAIIEQDMYPVEFDLPLGIATRAQAFYRSIGFA